jgi:AraC-like DNA-binding protein
VVVGRAEFRRAARFLKLIVEHVQTASLSDLHVADLSSAGRAVEALEREQARLRATLHRQLPAASPIVRRSGGESHADQLVHALLEDIEMEYGKQLTLQGYARELGMNAAYLSTLFSKTVGVPFKAYLTDLRLQKAKELLSNPANTVSEVAFQVGYATEDRFRSAFKQATGLSPKQWRETLRAQRPNPV